MVAMPPESAVAVEVYPPPESVIVPDGVAPLPVTVTFTLRLDVATEMDAAGVTVMDGISGVVTVSGADPMAGPKFASPL